MSYYSKTGKVKRDERSGTNKCVYMKKKKTEDDGTFGWGTISVCGSASHNRENANALRHRNYSLALRL